VQALRVNGIHGCHEGEVIVCQIIQVHEVEHISAKSIDALNKQDGGQCQMNLIFMKGVKGIRSLVQDASQRLSLTYFYHETIYLATFACINLITFFIFECNYLQVRCFGNCCLYIWISII
jgi:hypothetical protein